MSEQPTYQAMLAELNALLQSIEHDAVSVDDISSKLDNAYTLLEQLKGRLTSAEARVEEIINTRSAKGTNVTLPSSEEPLV